MYGKPSVNNKKMQPTTRPFASNPPKIDSKENRILNAFLILSFIFIAAGIFQDYQLGGNSYKQGDWLINNGGELVRRGIFGSIIISASDLIGANPLQLVISLQIVLLASLFASIYLIKEHVATPELALLLMTSSAFFCTFWVADIQGSIRKELIVFLGISIFSYGAMRLHWPLIWTGSLIYYIGLISHEAMLLFFPITLIVAALTGLHRSNPVQARILFITSILIIFLITLYTIKYYKIHDTHPVCNELLTRGLEEKICTGAIQWLDNSGQNALATISNHLSTGKIFRFIVAYFFALLPIIYILKNSTHQKKIIFLTFFTALPFLPLYFIALDWGRWISFHVFSLSLIIFCMAKAGDISFVAKNKYYYYAIIIISISLSPSHMIGILRGGSIEAIAHALARLAS